MDRNEIREKMRKRLAEGFNQEEREKFRAIPAGGDKDTTFVKGEVVLLTSEMRLLAGVPLVTAMYGAMQASTEIAITGRLSKEDFMKATEEMWDHFASEYTKVDEEKLEAVLDAAEKVNVAAAEAKEKIIAMINKATGKDVVADAMKGFDIKDGENIAIPKDWDKNVN